MHSLEQSLIAEAEQVGPLTVQDIQRVFSALTPPDVAGLVADVSDEICNSYEKDGDGYYDTQLTLVLRRLKSALTHLAAENALLREREGWLPIETAPKDVDILVGEWMDGEWKCSVYRIRNEFWREEWDDLPTHWRSLPASPSHREQSTPAPDPEPEFEPTSSRRDDWHYDSQGYCDNPGRGY